MKYTALRLPIYARTLLMCICLLACAKTLQAQLHLPSSVWFQNQYLANPAMAGLQEKKVLLNASYNKLWSDIPGSPVTETITADYGFNDRIGAGIVVMNDKAGLLKRNKIMGTYSYHIPFNDKHSLHLGLSAGVMMENLDKKSIIGSINDASLNAFSSRGTYFDADFGIAYAYNQKLYVQAAMPNLVSQYRKYSVDAIDNATFFAAVSYKTKINVDGAEPIGIEPKVCYRAIKGYDDIVDLGADLTFLDKLLHISAMYHSTSSVTFSTGLNFKFNLGVHLYYDTKSADTKGLTTGDSYGFALQYIF